MDNPVTERTPLVIAAEINMLTFQTKKILLASAIEIGRRLHEAKALVKHGEWGKWLEESVSYSQKTAERLIKLYEEYGPNFPDESGRSKSTLVSNLTYTQPLTILTIMPRIKLSMKRLTPSSASRNIPCSTFTSEERMN